MNLSIFPFSFNSLLSFRSPIWTYNYPKEIYLGRILIWTRTIAARFSVWVPILYRHFLLEKPIISPGRTDNRLLYQSGPDWRKVYYQSGDFCFVVYPTQTPCFHSVPLVRRIVAGMYWRALAIIAVANVRPPTDPSGVLNLLPKCKVYFGCHVSTFYFYLIKLLIPLQARFLYRLGFRVRISSRLVVLISVSFRD